MSDPTRRCKNCSMWKQLHPDRGECRKHSPTFHRSQNWGEWPMTFATDWCGEFAWKSQEDANE